MLKEKDFNSIPLLSGRLTDNTTISRLYMAELYRFLFEEFGLKKVEFDLNHNTLYFIVDT
jgi:hypothetical protein